MFKKLFAASIMMATTITGASLLNGPSIQNEKISESKDGNRIEHTYEELTSGPYDYKFTVDIPELNSSDGIVKTNILFVVDTSSSMGTCMEPAPIETDPCIDPQTRLESMQDLVD
jgi:hypothetical protein